MRRGLTLSGLAHRVACPGSLYLDEIERGRGPEARMGHAIHELCENAHAMRSLGYSRSTEAQARTIASCHRLDADDAGRLGYLARHVALPIPAHALTEVSLGYFPDGSVRRIEGGAGHYPDVGQLVSGQLDYVWAEREGLRLYAPPSWDRSVGERWRCPEGSTLYVVDLKTGDPANVDPIGRNWQLRVGALMAARWTGATRVRPAIVFVNAAHVSAALRQAEEHREAAAREREGGNIIGAIGHEALAEGFEREAREGRWSTGDVLEAAALDEIERELNALPVVVAERARIAQEEREYARADQDERRPQGPTVALPADREQGRGGTSGDRRGGGVVDVEAGGRDRGLQPDLPDPGAGGLDGGDALGTGRPPVGLILGSHCTYCDSRGNCPAFAAEALSIARATGHEGPLTAEVIAHQIEMLSAVTSWAANVKAAGRAWVETHGGELALPDGDVYGPAIEPTTSYKSRETRAALVALGGEALADAAAEYSGAGIKRAFADKGREREWSAVRRDLEASGATVATGREVWRKRRPMLPVEVGDGEVQRPVCAGTRALAGAVQEGAGARGPVGATDDQMDGELIVREAAEGAGEVSGSAAAPGHAEAAAAPGGDDVCVVPEREQDRATQGGEASPVATRATCPVCGREVRVNGDGSLRAHKPCSRRWLTDAKVYPGEAAPVESAGTEPPAEAPRQLAIVGA